MEDYLTVTEVSARLGVPQATIRQWIRQGKLPAQRAGPVWLVHVDDLARAPQLGAGKGWPKGKPRGWRPGKGPRHAV